MEGIEKFNDTAKRSFMSYRRIAVSSVILHHSIPPVKLAVMLLTLYSVKHFLNQIVDKEHFQFNIRIVHSDRQIICDVIAECTNSRIIIWSYPFTHKIRETVNHNSVAVLFTISKEQLFTCFLAKTIFRSIGKQWSLCQGIRRMKC